MLSSLSGKGHSGASQPAAPSRHPGELEPMRKHLRTSLACLPADPWPPPIEMTPWRLSAPEARRTAKERTWSASVHRLHTAMMAYVRCSLESGAADQASELESMLRQCIKVIATKIVVNTRLLPSDLNESLQELLAASKEIAVLKHCLDEAFLITGRHEPLSTAQVLFIQNALDTAYKRLRRSKQTLAELRGW